MDEYPRKTSPPPDTVMSSTTKPRSSYPAPSTPQQTNGRYYSFHFPEGHHLNSSFIDRYRLQDELGSGGYGFVMTAHDVVAKREVAVKFIIKDKVPEHAWMEEEVLGRLPTEVVILGAISHDNIVKSLDLYEDHLYFYLVRISCPSFVNACLMLYTRFKNFMDLLGTSTIASTLISRHP